MGSEDRGVNPSVLKIVDEKAKLPMFRFNRVAVSVSGGAFYTKLYVKDNKTISELKILYKTNQLSPFRFVFFDTTL
jgi:hypothetical protein